MNRRQKNFIQDLELCLLNFGVELKNRKNGVEGEATINELDQIIQELFMLKERIISGHRLPESKDRYFVSFANAFKVWNWNMQNPTSLYEQLAKLNESYKKL